MSNVHAAGMVYASQLETANLALIDELSKQVFKRRTDSYELQTQALRHWSKNMSSMNDFLYKPKADIKSVQLSSVRNLVDHAFRNIPFYRELYGDCGYVEGDISSFSDFAKLPIVTKAVLNSYDDAFRLSDSFAIENVDTARTSGSSGKPFTVYRNDEYIVLEHLHTMRFYNSCLPKPLLKRDWIYLIHHSGLAFSSLDGNYRTFQLPDLLTDTPLGKHLLYLRPKLLVTLPSCLPIILQHKAEIGACGVEAILTNSEGSTQEERNFYSAALGVPVFDEYSSEEIGMIATQCRYGRYHVAEDNVYLEVINTDEQDFGNVICTGLSNKLMPLIRYDHGDLAKVDKEFQRCECGSYCTTLVEINGRRDDAFRTREHKLVPSASILAAVDDILLVFDRKLEAFRLIQKSSEVIELLTKYVGGQPSNMHEVVGQLRTRLSMLFGYPISLLHREVGDLPEQKSYKRRSIVREWECN